MTSKPWYVSHPHWLDAELAALDAADIRHHRDEEAFARGIARLYVAMTIDGEGPLRLVVTFPESYPYFRFDVQAEGLTLPFHQNPFAKNLCLLPRETAAWNPRDTVASVLTAQLPKLLRAARATWAEEVAGLEVPQAEPVGSYYPFVASNLVIVPAEVAAPPAEAIGGSLTIATSTPHGGKVPRDLRGAVVEVADRHRRRIDRAGTATRRAFGGQEVRGLWRRLAEPLLVDDAKVFVRRLVDLDAALADAPANVVDGGFLRVWAVLFPEEVGHRAVGEGWLFVCHFDGQRDRFFEHVGRPQAARPRRR